ncbi:MAG TPA: hypothetical protein DEA22_07035 [Blastocatellia bacterium]|nr:hypothetical protein [Blastocatellia bacterium]
MNIIQTVQNGWDRFWFSNPTTIENIGLARIGLGLGLILLNISEFHTLLTLNLSGPYFYYIERVWYFKLLGIETMIPALNLAFFALLMAATVGVILGWRTRISAAVLILCIFYLMGVRDSIAGDEHHRYYMWVHALVFLAIGRAGEVLGLDARRARRPMEAWEATWPIRAAQAYVAWFYFISAVAKVRVSGMNWLATGAPVQKMLLVAQSRWGVDDTTVGRMLSDNPTLALIAVVMTMTVEFGFPLLLFVRSEKLRLIFLLGIAFFHITNAAIGGVNFWVTPFLFIVFFDLGKRFEGRARSLQKVFEPSPAGG